VAAGGTTLLCAAFAGLGAVIAPTDWPETMSYYNLHAMPPAMAYASWGVVIALVSQTTLRLIQSMRARHCDWTLAILTFCSLFAFCVAEIGTLPYCICDDPSSLNMPYPLVTFGGEAPAPSGPTLNTPSSHQDDPSR